MYYTVYILYSATYDKIYIGFTSHLINRFRSHNSLATKGWTIKFRPWEVIYCEYFEEKFIAMEREKVLKGQINRLVIRNKIKEMYSAVGFISV